MALATQCPFCQTTFRVAQDQLKLRGGLVRCGNCKEVFNGNEHLVSPEIAQQLIVAPATPAENKPAPTAWPSLPGNANAAPTTATPSTNISPATPAPAASAWMASANLSAAFASIAAETNDAPWGTPAEDASATPLQSDAAAATPAAVPLPGAPTQETGTATPSIPAEQQAINTLTQELSYPIPTTSSSAQAEAAAVTAGANEAGEGHEEAAEEETVEDQEYEEEDDADAPAFVQKAERRERLNRIARVVMSVGAVLLSITLLLQATYAWRNTISAWLPSTRPLFSSVCASLHCSVGLPTNIEQLSLESSELQLVPPNQNIYTLTLLLRNRGYSTQAWPYMEITLNDADEKALTRRVFTPREYLRSADLVDDGLAGESEQQVKLTFELTQPAASGYRIYLFFP